MSGDSINIGGSVSGSNIAGQGNTVDNRGASFGLDPAIAQRLAALRSQVAERPEDAARAAFLDELDSLERDLEPGADVDPEQVTGRLTRLQQWAEYLQVAQGVAGLVEAVQGWFA